MVNLLLLIITLFTSLPLFSISVVLPAKVTVEVENGAAYEGQSIPCIISIIRDRNQAVDLTSFVYHNKPLAVQFAGETTPDARQLFSPQDPNAIVVSKYRFSLPPQEKGLYVIDTVSVKVGGYVVTSVPVTYEVIGPQINSSTLTLEGKVLDSGPFYPGQHIKFQYRISFSSAIELSKEELPLLNLTTFRNVGAPKVETIQEGNSSLELITQEVVALQPGRFTTDESIIEGHGYAEDAYGRKVVNQQLLRATAPPIEIQVEPFPLQDKPPSFSGTIGIYYYQVQPLKQKVPAYEKLPVEISATGQGEIETVAISPEWLKKQLAGSFEVSDIPPQGEISGNKVRFVITLRPLSSTLKEIPPLQFSSFDPSLKRYFTVSSKPVAITVLKNEKGSLEESAKEQSARALTPETTTSQKGLPLIEISSNEPLPKEAAPLTINTGTLLLITLIFLLLAVVVKFSHDVYREKKSKKKSEDSRALIMQAMKAKNNLQYAVPLLKKALLLRLFETKETKELFLHPESLEQYGIQGEIRKFLCSLEEKRFSGMTERFESKEILDQAAELYYRLR